MYFHIIQSPKPVQSEAEGSKIKSKIKIVALVFIGVLACFQLAEAQQRTGKVPRIGLLFNTGSTPPQALVQGLRDLGYVEGENITFEYRTTQGNRERYADLAAELVRLKVDLIVADGSGPSTAAKTATRTIPIVMTSSTDPVGTGLIASLARPGGNLTGLTSVSGELGGKTLELLKEIVPGLSRVVIPGPPPGSPTRDFFIQETDIPARSLKIQIIESPVLGPKDYESVFRVAIKERANGLLVRIPPSTPTAQRKQFVELVAKKRLPAIYQASNWVDAGGLVSYGADRNVQLHRVAIYVDKILKGAKPADLPVEQPMKFEFVINLKTAKQIGLTIPPNVLARADKVIK
jgi:putative tryptophan/tyrosine transport system substrate-binding protein